MTARPPRRGRPLALGLLAVLSPLLLAAAARNLGAAETTHASASAGRRVLLVTTDPAGEIAPAVVTRLRGELRAARFEMDVATISADAPRRGSVEELAARDGVTAALGIFVGSNRVEMWAADASAGRTLMQNLPLDPGVTDRRATIVAVKAVDLLKATLAEIWSAPSPPLPATPADPLLATTPPEVSGLVVVPLPPVPPPAPEPYYDRIDITVGAGWLQEGGNGGWAPLLAIAAALGSGRFAARVTLSALGQGIDVAETAGSARLTQEIALAELVLRSRGWHRLRGALSIGAGAHRLSIDGRGAPGFSGVSRAVWSLAAAAGASVSLDVSQHWLVALDARAVENLPATDVRIDSQSAAHVGHPIVWLALAAGMRFQ